MGDSDHRGMRAIILHAYYVCVAAALLPDDPAISYIGRHHVNSSIAQFDWVATGFRVHLSSTEGNTAAGNITAELSGHARFAVFVGNTLTRTFSTSAAVASYELASGLEVVAAGGTLTVLKTTEPFSRDHA